MRDTFGCQAEDVSPDTSVARSDAWHVCRRLQPLGGTDRSTGLTPGPGGSGQDLFRLGDEDSPWLRALVARDDPAPLEHVDQPPRPRVAHPQPPLEERHGRRLGLRDRKSTRLNSSHGYISYAVFCLKKKKKKNLQIKIKKKNKNNNTQKT